VTVVFVTIDLARRPGAATPVGRAVGEDFVGLTGCRPRSSVLGAGTAGTITDLGGEYSGPSGRVLAIAPDGTVRLTYPWSVTYPQLERTRSRWSRRDGTMKSDLRFGRGFVTSRCSSPRARTAAA
jgi:hypothetical protein